MTVAGFATATIDGLTFPCNFLPALRGLAADRDSRTWFRVVATGGGRAFGIDSSWQRVFAVTVQAAWLIPYESELNWMVPLAAIVLLVPFFRQCSSSGRC